MKTPLLPAIAGLALTALAPNLAHAVDCNSLFAARVAENLGIQCNTPLVANDPGSRCLAGETPDECIVRHYDQLPTYDLPDGTGPYTAKWLPKCADGTDSCVAADQVRCTDGTRPMVYAAKALDSSGDTMYSNGWIIYFTGAGGACSGDTCYTLYADGKPSAANPAQFQHSLSTYHADYQASPGGATTEFNSKGGMLSRNVANPNLFVHYNVIDIDRCANQSSDRPSEDVSLASRPGFLPTDVAQAFHHGQRQMETLFSYLDSPAGRDLGGGGNQYLDLQTDLPPLANATTIILYGHSDGGVDVINMIDWMAAELRAIAPQADVRMFLDGRWAPALDAECQYSGSNGCTSVFDGTHQNPDPITQFLPDDLDPTTSDAYSDAGFLPGGTSYDFFSNIGTVLDGSCEAVHGADAKQCHDYMHVVLNHVETPFFISVNQEDGALAGGRTGFSDDIDYTFPLAEWSLRAGDLLYDLGDGYGTLSEIATGGNGNGVDSAQGAPDTWTRGIWSHRWQSSGTGSAHVYGTTDDFWDTYLTRCDASDNPIETVSLHDALFDWVTYDTEVTAIGDRTAIEDPTTYWLDGDDCIP